jgi:hypothetical protein
MVHLHPSFTAWQYAFARRFKGICLGAAHRSHRDRKPSPSGGMDWLDHWQSLVRRQSNHVKSKYEKSSHVKSNLSHFTASNTSLHAKWHKLRILVLKLQLQCIRPCSSCAGNHWLLLPPDFSVTLVGNRGTYLSKGRKTLLSLSIFQLQGQNPGTLVTSPIADQWILIPVIPQNMVQPMVQWSNGPIGLDMFGSIMIHPKYPKFCSSFGVLPWMSWSTGSSWQLEAATVRLTV